MFFKFIHVDIKFSNRYNVTYIKKRLLKNVLHKHDKEKKNYDAELTKKIQYIRSRCDGITWFVIYRLIQRNVKKAEENCRSIQKEVMCLNKKSRSLPFQAEDIITKLSY